MSFDISRARTLLQEGNLTRLFVEALGWEPSHKTIELTIGSTNFPLSAIADKCGFTVWLCPVPDAGMPDHATRLKIDRALTQTSFEHLLIFATEDKSRQLWMWMRREKGKPLCARTHEFLRGQSGDSLLQKLQLLFISLEEEESGLFVTQVAERARAAFDLERVTRAFYRDFDVQRKAFLKFISGIDEVADREWYASVTLNRLMFVYFIQRKGFLDSDPHYLRNRLIRCQSERGKDKFYSFYRYFLLRLFHEGFGQRPGQRAAGLEKLLGRIPYLNGGIFDMHELEKPERYGKSIQIPDQAFEQIFDYFDRYQWHLDERPLRDDDEINPDVLGYIFEKYINQKQMGAYYTKEDITEYISKNTVLPFLFETARAKCRVSFENPQGPTVWDLLRENPDRYIYDAVRHGIDLTLPPEIAIGVDTAKPDLIERRKTWNRPAPGEFALPTEIWREVVARRTRCVELRRKLAAGEVADINDFITLNLDIRQFAQDVITHCEGPDLLRSFWHAIEKVTILDPTCGSGAFLFAALNILEPIYEACLDRMESFLNDEAARLDASSRRASPAGNPILPHKKFEDFTRILDRVAAHPNRRYFIFKSIILNNLFGVDIMEEAVEICKLRLFLKLAAQVDPDPAHDNLGIEPLPDIDFNIRAGNTLVGYATYDEVKKAVGSAFDFDNAMDKISVKAADLQQTFDAFRQRQTEGDGSVPPEHKQELRTRLKALEAELNQHLAGEYGVKAGNKAAYNKWLKSHQPFHWFIEFYGIISSGGFDVIIGNPPWREYAAVKSDYSVRNYQVQTSGNLYALCSERALHLLAAHGIFSFIVQLPIVSSSRMIAFRKHLTNECSQLFFIPCDDRPGKLFEGLQHCRSCIFMARKKLEPQHSSLYTTGYNRWSTMARNSLFQTLCFSSLHDVDYLRDQFPKMNCHLHISALNKVFSFHTDQVQINISPRQTDHYIFYQEATQYWIKAVVGLPYYAKNGKTGAPAHGRYLYFENSINAQIISTILNSSLFYSYFVAYGDCFHLSDTLATSFPLTPDILRNISLKKLSQRLHANLKLNATEKTILTKEGDNISYDEFNVSESKPIIDEIDRVLAKHYGFTEEELDFIINYDIKYRMGRDAESEEE